MSDVHVTQYVCWSIPDRMDTYGAALPHRVKTAQTRPGTSGFPYSTQLGFIKGCEPLIILFGCLNDLFTNQYIFQHGFGSGVLTSARTFLDVQHDADFFMTIPF